MAASRGGGGGGGWAGAGLVAGGWLVLGWWLVAGLVAGGWLVQRLRYFVSISAAAGCQTVRAKLFQQLQAAKH